MNVKEVYELNEIVKTGEVINGREVFYLDIEKSCENTLLRINKIDSVEEDEPCVNAVMRLLDEALTKYNKELTEAIDRKYHIIELLSENNIIGLEKLLHSLKEIKITIKELQENIDYCIKRLNMYRGYIAH